VLQPNAVLGGDGFGFRPGPLGIEQLEHVGTIVVGDDVEVGSCTTIDRARFGRTVIGRGTKIDNLCQVAHNVRIGEHCLIAAQTGISGSTIVGDRCILGGQVGTVGHVRIGDGCMIAARSGISKDLPDGSVVYGFVAGPHLERKREDAAVRRLPELLERVRELERRLGAEDEGSRA
jgi:UDP-3-O-[3-hydroxymyristoyl] glucosamine N-acyltransferase